MFAYAMMMVENYLSSLKREEGQGMAEYGLILALVAVVVIVALTALGPLISDIFDDIAAGFGA